MSDVIDMWRLRAERAEQEVEKLRAGWHERDMEIRVENARLRSDNTRLRVLLGKWLSLKLIGLDGDEELVVKTRAALGGGVDR